MKKIFILLSSLICCQLQITIFAAPAGPEAGQNECLTGTIDNVDQQKQELQNWIIENRRSNPSEYEQRINQLEAAHGVFDISILPELIGMGVYFQEQQNHQQATDAFQRALYIIRVNDGLYSTRQLPLLDFLIESNSARGEWKQVADNYDMMHWLYRRNYTKSDPRQLQALKRLRSWYMESYNKDTGRTLEQLFSSAEALYNQALGIMLLCTNGNQRESLCFWHKSCCADAGTTNETCPLDRS
jgi:tetratricopeptide (TPR) repeat protein